MEPLSAVAIVHGLARSLMSTCTVLEETALWFETDSIGDNYREAMISLSSIETW